MLASLKSLLVSALNLRTPIISLFVAVVRADSSSLSCPECLWNLFVLKSGSPFKGGGDKEDEDRRPSGPLDRPRTPESQSSPGQAAGVLWDRSEGGSHAGLWREAGGQARWDASALTHDDSYLLAFTFSLRFAHKYKHCTLASWLFYYMLLQPSSQIQLHRESEKGNSDKKSSKLFHYMIMTCYIVQKTIFVLQDARILD